MQLQINNAKETSKMHKKSAKEHKKETNNLKKELAAVNKELSKEKDKTSNLLRCSDKAQAESKELLESKKLLEQNLKKHEDLEFQQEKCENRLAVRETVKEKTRANKDTQHTQQFLRAATTGFLASGCDLLCVRSELSPK